MRTAGNDCWTQIYCCTHSILCVLRLRPQAAHKHVHAHINTHTQTHTHAHIHTHTHTHPHTRSYTHTHTRTHTTWQATFACIFKVLCVRLWNCRCVGTSLCRCLDVENKEATWKVCKEALLCTWKRLYCSSFTKWLIHVIYNTTVQIRGQVCAHGARLQKASTHAHAHSHPHLHPQPKPHPTHTHTRTKAKAKATPIPIPTTRHSHHSPAMHRMSALQGGLTAVQLFLKLCRLQLLGKNVRTYRKVCVCACVRVCVCVVMRVWLWSVHVRTSCLTTLCHASLLTGTNRWRRNSPGWWEPAIN